MSSIPIRLELPMGFPMGSSNAFLFLEPVPTLIDTGIKSEKSLSYLQQGLKEHGLAIQDLARIVLTHPHMDHFGLAGTIAAKSKAIVEIFHLGKPWLVNPKESWQQYFEHFQKVFKSLGLTAEYHQPEYYSLEEVLQMCDPVPENRIVTFADQSIIKLGNQNWQVLHTPGHFNPLTCFYQPETQQLFSSDMIIKATTPIPYGTIPNNKEEEITALPLLLQSWRLLEQLDLKTVHPGHGASFSNGNGMIVRHRNYLNERKKMALQFVENGNHISVAELADKLYPKCPKKLLYAVIWNTIGFLDILRKEGLVGRVFDQNSWRFMSSRSS